MAGPAWWSRHGFLAAGTRAGPGGVAQVWRTADGLHAADVVGAAVVLRTACAGGVVAETRTLPDPGLLEDGLTAWGGLPRARGLGRWGWRLRGLWPTGASWRVSHAPGAGLHVRHLEDVEEAVRTRAAWAASIGVPVPADPSEVAAVAARRRPRAWEGQRALGALVAVGAVVGSAGVALGLVAPGAVAGSVGLGLAALVAGFDVVAWRGAGIGWGLARVTLGLVTAGASLGLLVASAGGFGLLWAALLWAGARQALWTALGHDAAIPHDDGVDWLPVWLDGGGPG